MDSEFGLGYARKLGFTDIEYQEALKMIHSPEDVNQLLLALLQVSQQTAVSGSSELMDKTKECQTNEESTASSCYSSISSVQSSSSSDEPSTSLRTICIDGPNVARTHGKDVSFSWKGIKLCVDWFLTRKHRVKVFVPADRCFQADKAILSYLKSCGTLVEIPSGCNDDMFVIKFAREENAVIVSNDLFRSEKRSDCALERFIHHNRLPYVFVDDLFIPADDPLGRPKPTLDEFLSGQDYQRNGLVPMKSNQQFNRHRKKLQATRSLPT